MEKVARARGYRLRDAAGLIAEVVMVILGFRLLDRVSYKGLV